MTFCPNSFRSTEVFFFLIINCNSVKENVNNVVCVKKKEEMVQFLIVLSRVIIEV